MNRKTKKIIREIEKFHFLHDISQVEIKYGTKDGDDLCADMIPSITCDAWLTEGQHSLGDHHMMRNLLEAILWKPLWGPCGICINGKVYERTMKVTKEIEDYCKENNIPSVRIGFNFIPPKYRKLK